jgi:DNA polymerase-3 subunit alpha (Gram-positive type)
MFNKDLLVIDLEATGLDSTKHEIIQIGAVLLDKKTLKEKDYFSTYIKPKKWKNKSAPAMKVNKIAWEMLKSAPSLKLGLIKMEKHFHSNEVIIANYGSTFDIEFLKKGFRDIKRKYPYEYHVFNIWPLCYTYAAKHKLLKNTKRFTKFRLEDLAHHFKLPFKNHHDALADARIEGQILQNIIKTL